MLKEKVIEKDCQIKALYIVVDELKTGYSGVKSFILKNNALNTTEELVNFDEQKVLKTEKDLEQIRETMRENSLMFHENPLESER